MVTSVEAAVESLRQIKSTEPPLWLVPKQGLSQAVRAASKHLFSILKPHSPKSPFDQLLIEGFDAEQIWQQIDLQSQPLLSTLRREFKKFEKHPEDISKLKEAVEGGNKKVIEENGTDTVDDNEDGENDDDMDVDEDNDNDNDEDDDDEEEAEEEEEGKEKERGREEENEREGEEKGWIEDKFLKIKELQEYLEEDEVREFGLKKRKTKRETKKDEEDTELEDDDEEEEKDDDDDDEAEEEEDDLRLFDGDDEDKLANARYEDFFSRKKNEGSKGKGKFRDSLEEDFGSDDEQDVDKRKDGLSTHEKELDKLRSEIEQMEKANLDPKVWTMRGEVTAAQRQRNSALEVDLDFEHNVRPAPIITEEVTASLEDLIKTRISEGWFDDVPKAPTLSSKAPKEIKELDENKSKKSLGEVYEEEFVQKTDPASAPLTFSDDLKKEASMLFKKLCLKLDALSHFHFTPKPVVEDMSIQINVPALAMEEIAPMAVSDAAMLAPEEVFSGKGDIKEEAEFAKAERKRRRANKKRKFKAETAKRMANKPGEITLLNSDEAKEQ